jgi:hypothetical protein
MPAFDQLDDLGLDESLDGSGGGTVGLERGGTVGHGRAR